MSDQVDLLIRGTLVNVLSGNMEDAAVAVDDGEIVALAERPAKRVIETEYVTPGLINGHMHIESSMVTLPRFGQAAIPHGVTCIIADPHEIGNVLGAGGVRSLIADAEQTPLRVRFTVPSSVPASPLQDAGATIDAATVDRLLGEERVVGLGEVMDSTAVATGDESVHAKIRATRKRGLTVDGHLPRVEGPVLHEAARYLDTDHESIGLEEARRKIDAGLRVFLREGSSSRNLDALKPLVEEVDTRRLALCTDNFYPADLAEGGGIGDSVARLIRDGHDPVDVVQMATLNAAEWYGLPFGRVAPGAPADLVLLDDLETWDVAHVVVDGEVDPTDGDAVDRGRTSEIDADTVHFPPVSADELALEAAGPRTVRVIDHTNGEAERMVAPVPERDGALGADTDADILPLAVVERHGRDGSVGRGFVHGLGLDRGAVGSTVAHDAHNLVVAGVEHSSMARVANHLRDVGGGVAVYDPTRDEITSLSLPIAGLMTGRPVADVARALDSIESAAAEIGFAHPDGVMLIDNLALEVIPDYRLTNRGLVDVSRMEHVPVVADEEQP